MRKAFMIFFSVLFVLLFVACNSNKETPTQQEQTAGVDEVMEEDTELEQEDEEDAVKEEETSGTEADETDSAVVNDCDETINKTENEENNCEDENSSQQKDDAWKKPDKIENMDHLEIVHLAYDIFEAQDRKDYDFLESVAAEGTTVDRKHNKFKFENVTYPFEMDFFTKEDLGNLEFRYTHEENGIVYVGFGAIDYEEESSFVIDFEFVNEDGKWKMRSMDINK